MTIGYSEIIFASVSLNLKNITKKKVPKTRKQKIGGKTVTHIIPGRTDKEWELSGNGIIFDWGATAATTNRELLEDKNDLNGHYYNDGLITGTFVITDLTFTDNENNPLHYTYSIKLLELNETT